jgi:two-component system osmolarity sensor histidine kinase EnvZ
MSVLKYFSIKRYLPRSLLGRSLLILTLPVILILVISTYIFFERHWERMTGRLASAVAGEVAFLAEQISGDDSEAKVEDLTRDTSRYLQLSIKYVPGGKIRPDPISYIGRGDIIKSMLASELRGRLDYPYRILVDTEEKWIQVQVQMNGGVLIVTSPERRLFSSSGYVFLLWMIGISTFLMVVAILFMRNQIRPIKRLAIAADRLGKGRDVPFFKLEGAREVRQAARAFLGMRERIDRQIQQRTTMLAGVSHDLRTPLTRMKLQAEMLGDTEDAKALKSDISDMERMIDGYLQFARGEGDEAMERVNIMEILHRLESNYTRNGMNISVESKSDNYMIHLRPVAFERCINNILSNAQKHATMVKVTVKQEDENIVILIDDDGLGIDEDLHEDVFKPFFREDTSRNTKTGGVGLGLPIAKDIVLAHGGDIDLTRSPQKGLRVIIRLPL